jgi:hypothetical protein
VPAAAGGARPPRAAAVLPPSCGAACARARLPGQRMLASSAVGACPARAAQQRSCSHPRAHHGAPGAARPGCALLPQPPAPSPRVPSATPAPATTRLQRPAAATPHCPGARRTGPSPALHPTGPPTPHPTPQVSG